MINTNVNPGGQGSASRSVNSPNELEITASNPTSKYIEVVDQPVAVLATGLAIEDIVTVQRTFNGVDWVDWAQLGTTIQLTTTNNAMLLKINGRYRFVLTNGSTPVKIAWWAFTLTCEPDNTPLVGSTGGGGGSQTLSTVAPTSLSITGGNTVNLASLITAGQTPVTVTDTNSINLTAGGVAGHALQADVIVSPNVGNGLSILPNGLFVTPGAITNATETTVGASEIATPAEALAGTIHSNNTANVTGELPGTVSAPVQVVTPFDLKTIPGLISKAAGAITNVSNQDTKILIASNAISIDTSATRSVALGSVSTQNFGTNTTHINGHGPFAIVQGTYNTSIASGDGVTTTTIGGTHNTAISSFNTTINAGAYNVVAATDGVSIQAGNNNFVGASGLPAVIFPVGTLGNNTALSANSSSVGGNFNTVICGGANFANTSIGCGAYTSSSDGATPTSFNGVSLTSASLGSAGCAFNTSTRSVAIGSNVTNFTNAINSVAIASFSGTEITNANNSVTLGNFGGSILGGTHNLLATSRDTVFNGGNFCSAISAGFAGSGNTVQPGANSTVMMACNRTTIAATSVQSFVAASGGGTISMAGTAGVMLASQNCQIPSTVNGQNVIIGSVGCVNGSDGASGILFSENSSAGVSGLVSLLSSRGVAVPFGATHRVMGGFAAGAPSTANRRWEIDSPSGNVFISGTLTPGFVFPDFAEMFENGTGDIIDVGTPVTLKGDKVYPATIGDDVDGIVSATSAFVGGDTPLQAKAYWSYDEFGRREMEEIEVEHTNTNGEFTHTTKTLAYKVNPNFNGEFENIPRSKRPKEWTQVGMLGQVFVRINETVKETTKYLAPDSGKLCHADQKTNVKLMRIEQPYDATKGYGVAYVKIA